MPHTLPLAASVLTCLNFPEPKNYVDIRDHSALQRVVTEYLADFNATSKKPMNLVIFQVGKMEGGEDGWAVRWFEKRAMGRVGKTVGCLVCSW